MGECKFYLKAYFPDAGTAERAEAVLRAILEDVAKCQDDWQKIRYEQRSVAERHRELMERHPLVARFLTLPLPREDDPSMNYLAGHLEISSEFYMLRNHEIIYLEDYVWHLGSWDNIAELFVKFGAEAIGWIKEEWIDPYDLIDVEEREVDPEEVRRNFEEASVLILCNKLDEVQR